MRALLLLAWRDVRRRPGRAALAFLGVVLGVAALVAILVSTRAARDAYRDMYASLGGRASLEIVAEGLGGFDATVVPGLEGVPGVRAVVPVVVAPAALVRPGPRAAVVVLGIDPARDRAVREVSIVEGAGLGPEDGAVLLASFARAQGVAIGTSIRLLTLSGPADLRVVGLAAQRSLPAFPGGVVLLPIATAQRLFGLASRVSAEQIVVEDGARAEDVEARVRAALPAGLRVDRPVSRGLIAESSLRSAEVALSAVSLMSLVAAVFVILNAFSMNLAERRRGLATVRALGATRSQVASSLALEAGILGLSGTLVGIGVGIVAARGLALGLEQMLGVALPPPQPTASAILLALLVGPATTLGATILPARRAARRDPLLDLLGAAESPVLPLRRAAGVVGLAMVAVLVATTVGPLDGALPADLVAPSMALGLLGAALAFPAVLPALRRAALLALAPIVGAAGRLGLAQAVRRPVHTALSSTVLFVAVMASVGMGNELLSGVDDVRDWTRRIVAEDFFVRATVPESGTMSAAPLPLSVGDAIAALPGVGEVHRIRFIPAFAGRIPVIVMPQTFSPGRRLPLDLQATVGSKPLAEIGRGEAVVGTALARALSVGPGGEIELSTRSGPARLRVVATATEYTAGGQAVYVSWETAEEAFGAGGADAFMIEARPGRRAEAGAALSSFAAREGLLLQSNAEMVASVDEMVSGVVGLLWAALAVVFLVASLGVVNALTTNVLEQTRSIGTMRAVGMTRGQVRWMVVTQSLAMASVSLPPGALAGIALSRWMNRALGPVRGFPMEFRLAPGLVLGCVTTALAVAVGAAVLPAFRAARMQVTESLRCE